MAKHPNYTVLEIKKTIGFGDVDKGEKLAIQVIDRSNRECVIMIPHALEGDFLARLQGASGYAAKQRGEPMSQTMAGALDVEQVFVGKTHDGTVGLRLRLSSGMTLDLALSPSILGEMRSLIDELDSLPTSPAGSRVQ